MNKCTTAALLASCIALASCSAGHAIEIRSVGDPITSSKDNAIAVARSQLMLGNVGLALEGFRKALRENPSDSAAFAGIGDCYAAMNRYDLAQSNYEQALALAPRDPNLLVSIAAIFDQRGQHEKADMARAEASAAAAPRPPLQRTVLPQAASRPPVVASARAERAVGVNTPATGSITVELPAATPAKRLSADFVPAQEQPVALTLAEGTPDHPLARSNPVPTPTGDSPAAEIHSAGRLQDAEESPQRALPKGDARIQTAAITLGHAPAVLRTEAKEQQDLIPLLLSMSGVAPSAPPPAHKGGEIGDAVVAPAPRPRLERLSRGEVALITTSTPVWRPSARQLATTVTAVDWVPLMRAPREANVRILNAARKQGLAAAARSVLLNRGWRKIAVGDAPAVEHRSVVLYPRYQRTMARRLAAQFGIGSRMVEGTAVVLILGRDAVGKLGESRT